MKNVIVVDIDSTLYSFGAAFKKAAMEHYGLGAPDDPQTWNQLAEEFEDMGDAIACFPLSYSHEMIPFNKPYAGAIEGLNRLAEAGYELHYYTDRPRESEQATHDWLNHYGFPQTENVYVCSDKRADILANADRIVTVIDDRPRTLVWARYELGVENAFSIRHGYNKNLDDIPGITLAADWDELAPKILEKLPVLV